MSATQAIVGVGVARVPRQQAERIASATLAIAERVLRLLKAHVKGQGPTWRPDKDFRELFDAAVQAATKLPGILAQVREEVQRFSSSLDTDEIERYAQAELNHRFTRLMSDDEVVSLLATRYGEQLATEIRGLIKATRHERMATARAGNARNTPADPGPAEQAVEWEDA